MGAAVIDADQIGRVVVENNARLLARLARTFGKNILTSQKKLRRKRVAEIAFSNKSNKRKLDQLVHPFLLQRIKSRIKDLSKRHPVIVIDAALLFEWNLDRITSKVLVIQSGSRERLRRLKIRGIKTDDALARQRMQLSSVEYRQRADKVISNNTTPAKFEAKVKNWAEQFFRTN